ncbi:hypothetical protein DV736_g727, partial [Chaetothyriales sp. CBS 134916]
MADPFEVRMKFSSYLTHLSANQTSLMKTAHFALKHRDMDEDLHSCILEALEKPSSTSGSSSNMNNRANIMYFLDQHADVNVREGGHAPYVDFLRRDIVRIVEAVAVNGANVKVCRRVVSGLGDKKRLRESMWAVTGNDDDELDKMWDEGSDVTQEDYDIANEEADERRRFARIN